MTHQKLPPVAELDWSKWCLLLSVQNDRKRLQYEKLAISEGWTRAKLVKMLKSEKLLPGATGKREQPATSNEQRLSAHRGQLYTYRASPGDSGHVYIDVGFSVTRQIKSWAQVEKSEIIQSRKSSDGFELSKSRSLPKDLYTYTAYLDRVIDGDTLRLHIDLGFDTFIKETVRLRGINAPEVKTPAGEKARRYVAKALKEAREIIVRTHYEDKYGRYLIDLWIDDEYFNQKLLDAGLAGKYKG